MPHSTNINSYLADDYEKSRLFSKSPFLILLEIFRISFISDNNLFVSCPKLLVKSLKYQGKNGIFNQMMVTMATMFKMNFHYLNNVCGVMSQKHTHFY